MTRTKNNKIQIELWALNALRPYGDNAHTHPKAQVAKIAQSIEQYGFVNPIIVDENKEIIAGHGRLEAAKKLKLEGVPVIKLTYLTDVQKRALRLADNRLPEDAGWDIELLTKELRVLDDDDFNLELTGFDSGEIDKFLLAVKVAGLTDDDAVPSIPGEAVSKRGDVWQLGAHRVACGDSTLLLDVERLMGPELADCIWTDPPYNVNYEEKAKAHRETSKILNDNLDSASFYELIYNALSSAFTVSRQGAAIYVAHSESEGISFRKAFQTAGFYQSSCLVWKKNVFVLGHADYQWKHEPILYGWKPGASHSWHGGRDKTTVFEVGEDLFIQIGPNRWQISLGDTSLVITGENLTVEELHGTVFSEDKPLRNPEHPTMKPVSLIERMILNSTRRGELVFDPFGGSGSTLIACEKTDRIARLIELDPKYCDVIVKRWEDYTGLDAYLYVEEQAFVDMQSFSEIKEVRLK